jgi:spore germination protein GerM
MTKGRIAGWTVAASLLAGAIVAAFIFVPRWYAESNQPVVEPETPAPSATPKIKAHLYYVSEDGLRLVAVEREVAVGQGTLQQARRIVEAQLAPAPRPLVSAIPEGTKLRAMYVDSQGQAFVDLSREVSSAHTGGALEEILTVYSIVNAVTENLPAVHAVQILVDGREVDTLAGHVDLRRPLTRGTAWLQEPAMPSPIAGGVPTPPEKQ